MRPELFLRIASVAALVQSVLHTIGGVFGTPHPGAQQQAVAAMRTLTFPVMGLIRSYWDFFIGFGLAISIALALEGVLLWQLSLLAKSGSPLLRPMVLTFLLGYIALTINAWIYFFPPPVVTEIVIVLLLGMAFVTAGRNPTPRQIS